ncbi:discoidin domain-containing protein [Streptacidiphilus monticola]
MLGKVVLHWQDAYAAQFAVQTSLDGVHWTTSALVKDGRGGDETVRFPAVPAQFVRIQGVQRATRFGYSLFGVELYAVAGATPPPSSVQPSPTASPAPPSDSPIPTPTTTATTAAAPTRRPQPKGEFRRGAGLSTCAAPPRGREQRTTRGGSAPPDGSDLPGWCVARAARAPGASVQLQQEAPGSVVR